jgi:cobalt/nickel transport system permease protein
MGCRLKPQSWLLVYLASVVAITFIHVPAVLAALFAVALLGAGRGAWPLLCRTLLAVATFNLTVSLGYAAVALWQGNFNGHYLLLVNIRVVLMVFLGFWLVKSVDLLDALSGFPLLRLIATLAIGQIKTFERVLRDFRMAFQSRNPLPPGLLDRTRHAASQAHTLLDKSMASASKAALAMRSRGAFDD